MALDLLSAQRILAIDSELNKIRDYDILLDRVLFEARKLAKADAGSIYVKEGDFIAIKFAHNDTKQKMLPEGEKQAYPHFTIPVNEKTISGYVAMTGELLNIKNVYRLPKGSPYSYNADYDKQSGYKSKSMLTLPLKTENNKVLGVIQIINALNGKGELCAFTKEDEAAVTHLAEKATVALQRAYMTRSMIMRMIRMAEMRDPKETNAHVNRVASYALELYERWAFKRGYDQKRINKEKDIFKLAAMLHDVGKVAISDLILKKPASFTPEEYVIMQTHTSAGARLFDDLLSDFDTIAADVALTHHENWDGTGYPGWIDPQTGKCQRTDAQGRCLRRKGEEIPLWGRIVSIADVFDALISRRVYKEPWGEDEVFKTLCELSGREYDANKERPGAFIANPKTVKFDPELIELFFQVLPRIREIRARYPEED